MGGFGHVIRVLLVMVLALALLAGCGRGETVDVDQVRSYADPMAENILQAFNDDDYDRFFKDFSQTEKRAAPPEPEFLETNEQIKNRIGDYVSKEYWQNEAKDGLVTVFYRAKFTGEDDVLVRAIFREVDGEMKVAGFWLDSPKLRQP
ncbi:conserved hypothetical protein [Candidatus Desulforudis audaxviator MP104C]|uniref:DUF3887 domain-containing protein n=1 Tax=Desulforudis audaxviator (strain MP104C) TaxID=477974 RepID=B1I2Q6_DESAP|nr:DUF3887 domain-containing protein [Candidatus Desulforudis audaxviator]ACA59272.1 conserved hypothetical protein [Candidatus Desulforudis audaxviator MP104C]